MASKQQDSTTSSEEDGERALFTRNVENVEKAKRGLFEQAARRTRASTSAKPPVTDYVSSSMSSYHDDSDQDKTVDPCQLSTDSSDRRSRRLEVCELRKKQAGFSSGKSCCFYNNNYIHYGKFVFYKIRYGPSIIIIIIVIVIIIYSGTFYKKNVE